MAIVSTGFRYRRTFLDSIETSTISFLDDIITSTCSIRTSGYLKQPKKEKKKEEKSANAVESALARRRRGNDRKSFGEHDRIVVREIETYESTRREVERKIRTRDSKTGSEGEPLRAFESERVLLIVQGARIFSSSIARRSIRRLGRRDALVPRDRSDALSF